MHKRKDAFFVGCQPLPGFPIRCVADSVVRTPHGPLGPKDLVEENSSASFADAEAEEHGVGLKQSGYGGGHTDYREVFLLVSPCYGQHSKYHVDLYFAGYMALTASSHAPYRYAVVVAPGSMVFRVLDH